MQVGDANGLVVASAAHEPPHACAATSHDVHAAEIDGIAAYCRELDRCFFLPIAEFDGRTNATCGSGRRETASCAVLRWLPITRLGL